MARTEGFELFCDLCLADCLATGGTASRVVIQLKGHATFVSDAMAKDMMAMIDLLAGLDEAEYPRCVLCAVCGRANKSQNKKKRSLRKF